MASVSALGQDRTEIFDHYRRGSCLIHQKDFSKFSAFVSELTDESRLEVEGLRDEKKYKPLDPSVLMAIHVSRRALADLDESGSSYGINIGSSRGATQLWEAYHAEFMASEEGRVATLASPTTTLGNLSSWVGHDLQVEGPTISHSIACSTALHGMLNGIAWIQSGLCDKFLFGGSEAPNTAFTLAQMKALKIYAEQEQNYPCRSLDPMKTRNGMVLGEAAASFTLARGLTADAIAVVMGFGYATEPLTHNISISDEAQCFQKSMQMALGDSDPSGVDVIVAHAPGTIKGDASELAAIKAVFGDQAPAVTSNKWAIGHSLGASGAMSLQMAILMLQEQEFVGPPYLKTEKQPAKLNRILVNAVGFGGNAVSILISKV